MKEAVLYSDVQPCSTQCACAAVLRRPLEACCGAPSRVHSSYVAQVRLLLLPLRLSVIWESFVGPLLCALFLLSLSPSTHNPLPVPLPPTKMEPEIHPMAQGPLVQWYHTRFAGGRSWVQSPVGPCCPSSILECLWPFQFQTLSGHSGPEKGRPQRQERRLTHWAQARVSNYVWS